MQESGATGERKLDMNETGEGKKTRSEGDARREASKSKENMQGTEAAVNWDTKGVKEKRVIKAVRCVQHRRC